LIDVALSPPGSDLNPEETGPEPIEEVDLDELGASLLSRLNGISSDLALLPDFWTALDETKREALLDQLRYQAELHAYLSRRE
jgi:hypothetical protein